MQISLSYDILTVLSCVYTVHGVFCKYGLQNSDYQGPTVVLELQTNRLFRPTNTKFITYKITDEDLLILKSCIVF